MKTCSKCNRELDSSQFGNKSQCRDCWNSYRRAWRAAGGGGDKPKSKEQAQRATMKHRYGMTPEQYERRLGEQGGTCATCPSRPSDGRRFFIDHDHACCPGTTTCGNCIRGILCPSCNSALGYAKDSVETLLNLVKYLERPALRTK